MEDTAPKIDIQKQLNTKANKKYGVEPEYCFKYIPERDINKPPSGYMCTILIGDKEFCNNLTYPTKSEAATETANYTNTTLFLRKRQRGSAGGKRRKIDGEVLQKIEQPEKDCTFLSSKEELFSYLSDNVLAVQFKFILSNKAHNENGLQPRYDTQLSSQGEFTGYTSVVDYDGEQCGSLGLMVNQSQAEQSAAEVYLRNTRHLETIPFDDFLIQPYQGGVSKKIELTDVRKTPFIFTSTVMSDALQAFIDCQHMQNPRYYVKELENQYDSREFTVDGQLKPIMDCICAFEGKVFKARSRQVLRVVKQLTAEDILKHFCVTHLQERVELKRLTKICRSSLPQLHEEKVKESSPFHYSPMQHRSWKNPCLIKMDTYYDQGIESLITAGLVKPSSNNVNETYMHLLAKKEFARKPSFQGVSLSDMDDIMVGMVDPIDLNIFIIGNSQFSIKLLCKEGKIYCRKRRNCIRISPGHNILNLDSEYRAALPSLEIYLRALACDDLYFPNPPLPVVASCGVVVLMHDHEASHNDIFVLLRRRATGFSANSYMVSLLLNKLVEPEIECSFTPLQCTRDIKEWHHWEVEQLSEMTVDSVCLLMSKYDIYDNRWNDLLAQKKLPDKLIGLQEICLKEVRRREEEGSTGNVEQCITWNLPDSEIITKFESIGIHVESSNLCAFRAVRETTGVRIKYADIEKCVSVDLAVKNDKQHRGVVNRYHIWKGCQKYPVVKRDGYYDEVDADELAAAGEWDLSNDQFYESGTSALKYERKTNTGVEEESVEDDDANKGDRSERQQNISHEHCVWMKLCEAIDVCPMLLTVSETPEFKRQLNYLIVEANNVLEIKGIDQQFETLNVLNLDMIFPDVSNTG